MGSPLEWMGEEVRLRFCCCVVFFMVMCFVLCGLSFNLMLCFVSATAPHTVGFNPLPTSQINV